MTRSHDGYTLSTEHADVDLDYVCRWLSEESYWAKGRDHDVIRRPIAGSAPYSVHDEGGSQVDSVVADFEQRGVQRFLLGTKDAQEVYRRSGFAPLEGAHRFMEIDRRPTRAFILGHV